MNGSKKWVIARLVWALVSLAAFLYILLSEETPGWGKALAVMLAIGLWQIDAKGRSD